MFKAIAGAMVLALTVPAFADQPSYNYVQGGYQRFEIENISGFDISGDGFGVGGSFAFANNWHVIGGYSSTGFDFGLDLNQLRIGGGFHTEISSNMSVYADLAWLRAEIDAGAVAPVDESGYEFRVGLRSNATDRIEVEANLSYADLGDGADGTSAGGAAWYRFNDTFALGLTATAEEDAIGYGIGARVFFGK